MAGWKLSAVLAACVVAAACSSNEDAPNPEYACYVGLYASSDGGFVDIGPLSSAALRLRAADGQTARISPDENGVWSGMQGWSDIPSPAQIQFDGCPGSGLELTGLTDWAGSYERVDYETIDTQFTSGDLTLRGRLVMPPGEGPVPITILVHGSERYSAVDFYPLQRILPAMGIGAFVYDKRGTGGSDGSYSQDFPALADDAIAALAEARRLAGSRADRLGYLGSSQGGWIAPLAASQDDADFVIASYGMLVSPLAEDAGQAQQEIAALGYDEEVLASVRELTDATGLVLGSDFEEGREELAALKRQYRDEEWFSQIEGEVSGPMLHNPLWAFQFIYENFIRSDTSWGHEPMAVIRQVEVPTLYVIAEEDLEAPPDDTIRLAGELQAEGRLIDVAVFPDTDHGIINYVETEDGRAGTRYAEGYYRMLGDWILTGGFQGDYGNARLTAAPARDEN